MRKDKVSIIIPVYNAARHLEKCLNSVLNQTYDNIEVVIVNDGSTDNSKEICELFAEKNKQIKLINQENSGPSVARNSGIKSSTGKYIQFVDSDDTIEKDMTQKYVDSINDEVELVICGYRSILIETGNKKIAEKIPKHCGIIHINDFLNIFGVYYENWLINSLWNKFYTADVIKKNNIGFDPDIRLGEDLLFTLKYIIRCKRINVIPDVLYNYIALESGSLTRSYRKNLFINQKMLFQKVKEFLKENNSYNELNQMINKKMYFDSIIVCFENTINQKNSLNYIKKINEIKNIIDDETIIGIIYNKTDDELTIQHKFIRLLLVMKSSFGIYVYFSIKDFIRSNFISFFRVVKGNN